MIRVPMNAKSIEDRSDAALPKHTEILAGQGLPCPTPVDARCICKMQHPTANHPNAGFALDQTATRGQMGGTMAVLPDPPAPDSDTLRPTLKTIAAATGLAIATVSRALKDAPDIGEETKRRVRETAAQLGYRPNRAGVRLRTGKTNVIALVLSTEADVMNHTSQMIYSIAAALARHRLPSCRDALLPRPGPDGADPLHRRNRFADGVVLNQIMPDDPRIRYMSDRGFPFAAHGRSNMGIDHPYFDFDNEAYARLGVRAWSNAGRQRLLLIAPPSEHSYARHMIAGFSAEAAR